MRFDYFDDCDDDCEHCDREDCKYRIDEDDFDYDDYGNIIFL